MVTIAKWARRSPFRIREARAQKLAKHAGERKRGVLTRRRLELSNALAAQLEAGIVSASMGDWRSG
ncbi:MAG: hypothetical protein HYY23_13710 [Verrucomicrobia bacterium]|nr:hypothetical protein [Verrucomicrobiota bacterium]